MNGPAAALLMLGALAAAPRVAGPQPHEARAPGEIGTRYYVDSHRGRDGALGTTPAMAWRTVSRVGKATLHPGDVVSFNRGGTYHGQLVVNRSGSAAAPIAFTAYGSGAKPLLENAGAGPAIVVLAEGASHVVIKQLRLAHAVSAGVEIGEASHHNVVRDCEISDTGSGVTVTGRSNRITRNEIHDLHMIVNDSKPDNDFGAVGVTLGGGDNEVSYNRFVRCRAPSHDYGHDGGAVEIYGSVSGARIHHNYAEDSEGFIEIGGRRDDRVDGIVVSCNVAVDCHGFAVVHNAGNFAVAAEGLRFENNTVISRTGAEAVFWFAGDPTPRTAVVRNNLVVLGPEATVAHRGRSSFTHDHNLFWRIGGDSRGLNLTLDESDIHADPLLVDVTGGDFRPQAGSPAVGRGAPASQRSGAVTGASRRPNIGAYGACSGGAVGEGVSRWSGDGVKAGSGQAPGATRPRADEAGR